ncbi:MAG: hypothetical protein Q4B84_05040 [Clostridia bacterium]|nr:hypothetical protein [Clostridia bacterium]
MSYESVITYTLSQGGYWHINKPLARAIRLKYHRVAYAVNKRI